MSERNPSWSRDELLLALDLYLKHRDRLPNQDSDVIAALSSDLQRLAGASAGRLASFRNTNGVYMKLANFRAIDPYYIDQGKRGLSRGGRLELKIWSEFAEKQSELTLVSTAIRANLSEAKADKEEPSYLTEAAEGGLLTRMHRRRERNAKLVTAKKAQALGLTGRLTCEACAFDFANAYGQRGEGFIEAHHMKPLHTLVPGTTTRLEDLALLCANCHRIVHAKSPWLTMQQLKDLVESSRGRQTSSGTPL